MSYSSKPRARFDEDHLCVLDIETISGEEMEDGGFPPWPLHTPVVASLLTADLNREGQWVFDLENIRFGECEEALYRIDERLDGRSCVSYNGRGFDLPVLMLTAQKARIFDVPSLRAAALEPRFVGGKHYDLADRVSGFGAARGASLERLCDALGIPVKLGVDGSDVGKLYDRGDIDAIEQYCSGDVAATLLVTAHQRAMETGNPGYHASLTWQFARWAEDQCLDHLMPYAEVRDSQELQRLSLLGQLEAAQQSARLNAEWREQREIDASFGDVTTY